MNPLPLLFVLTIVLPASAATRRLSVRVARADAVWAKTWVVTDGSQFSFAGPLSGKQILINALAASDPTRTGLGDARMLCRQVLKGGAQGNVVDSQKHKGRRSGLTMNSLVEPSAMGVKAEYQLEHTPPGGKSVQVQSDTTLAYGRKKARAGPGYRLELMAEGDSGAGPSDEGD